MMMIQKVLEINYSSLFKLNKYFNKNKHIFKNS